jgi:serine/threonine protein kinase
MAQCDANVQFGLNIGAGQSGAVYDIGGGQVVKIQTLTDSALGEAIFLSSIRHPNIVTLFDACILDGYLHLTLEAGDETYAQWIERVHPLPHVIEQVKEEVECAVDFLHSYGIHHNDLHTQNIVMFQGTPKLIDFGYTTFGTNEDDYFAWGSINVYECPEGELLHHDSIMEDRDASLEFQTSLSHVHYALTKRLVSKVNLPYQTEILFYACAELITICYDQYRYVYQGEGRELVDYVKRAILSDLEFQIL